MAGTAQKEFYKTERLEKKQVMMGNVILSEQKTLTQNKRPKIYLDCKKKTTSMIKVRAATTY